MMDALASHWPALLVASVVAFAVAAVGGMLTDIGPWYHSLRFPAWKPPNWLFGPVWTVIFTLSVVTAVMAWAAMPGASHRAGLIALFALNAAFNIFWNVLFFRWRRPDWALLETAGLWLSILALILFIWPHSPIAALLLAPYLLWVSTAWLLNLSIVRLNAPFAGLVQPGSP